MASQSEIAYKQLRESILSATVLPGQHLPEVEWATRLKVGRFAIRESLKRLHGENLVSRAQNKYRVTILSAEEIREITQVRAVLEMGALRSLKKPLPAKTLRAIRRAADDYAALVKKGYFSGAQEADLRFHHGLIASAGNKRLLHLYESSNFPLLQATVGKNSVSLNDYPIVIREHAEICAALEKGNHEAAALALEKHLRRGEREVTGG